jgi:hypothetical protein
MEPLEPIWSSSNTTALTHHQNPGNCGNEGAKVDERWIEVTTNHRKMNLHVDIYDSGTLGHTVVEKAEHVDDPNTLPTTYVDSMLKDPKTHVHLLSELLRPT